VSVLYATRVKQYAFDALAALALIALALRARDRPESPGRCVALVVAAVCVVAFSASVLPVAVVAVLFAARHGWRAPAARRVVAVAVGLFGLFALGWSRLVLRSVPRPLHDSWDHNYVHLTSPWRAAADTWHVLDQFASGVFYRHGPTGPLLVAGLAVATARWHRDVLLLLLGPVAVAVGLAALGRVPLGGGRIDEYLYPGMALAAGLAVQNVVHHVHALAARPRVVDVALMALVVGFAVTAGLRQTRATPYPAADVHALDLAVGARRLPGDGVVVGQFSRYPYALYGAAPVRLVFSPAYSTGFAVVSSEPDVYILPAEYYEGGYDPDAAVRFASGYRRIWYIATDTPAFDTPPSIQQNEYVPEVRLVAAGFHVAERLRGEGAHADLLLAPGGG
jgi:MFS family permease